MRFSFSRIIRAIRSYFRPVKVNQVQYIPEVLMPVVPEPTETGPLESIPERRSPIFQASDKRAVIRKPSKRKKRRK